MAKFIGIGALVVWGLIIADVLRNPGGTQAASSGAVNIETPVISGLVGK